MYNQQLRLTLLLLSPGISAESDLQQVHRSVYVNIHLSASTIYCTQGYFCCVKLMVFCVTKHYSKLSILSLRLFYILINLTKHCKFHKKFSKQTFPHLKKTSPDHEQKYQKSSFLLLLQLTFCENVTSGPKLVYNR